MYINYKRAPYCSSKWIIVAPIIVEIGVLLSEFILNGTAYSQFLMLPLLLYYVYRVMKHKEDTDKATEAQIIEKKLQDSFIKLANENQEDIIAKEYFIIVPKERYLSIKRFMLVVLGNGDVYRYEVTCAKDNGFRIKSQATLCTDEKELVLVQKYTRKFSDNPKATAERIMALLAAGILTLGLVIIALVLWLGNITIWIKYVVYILIADFFLACIIISILNLFERKGKIVRTMYKIAIWNVSVWWFMIKLIFPSMLIWIGFIFVVIFPFSIVFLLLKGLSMAFPLSEQTILFVALSVGAIISAHYPKPIFALISQLLAANGHRYEKYFPMMVEYVYKPENLQFTVYLLYVMYLSFSTIYRFQTGGQPIWGNDTDLAVLESFLMFVAFSNMKVKHKATKLKFSELFKIMFAMWTTHDDKEDKLDSEIQ